MSLSSIPGELAGCAGERGCGRPAGLSGRREQSLEGLATLLRAYVEEVGGLAHEMAEHAGRCVSWDVRRGLDPMAGG